MGSKKRHNKKRRNKKHAPAPAPPAIRLVGVTKRYRRVAQSHKFLTLKSAFVGGNIFGALRPEDVFTALEDVSLDVARGETFGVIGANGAGKSTLMKIVAGTTKPTEGVAKISGRISALIELGAGFHPEISGRENVFINGIMLGLTRKQVQQRFDQIVAFAELEEFIDMPVRNYSSGMYMRLGFSVAIHVDPDLLVIDEVLAVGDESFVHKCLDKIGEFKRNGKTILLVTHGMDTVRQLCDRAAWINQGRVEALGDPMRVVDKYLEWVAEREESEMDREQRRRLAALDESPPEASASPAPTAGAPAPATQQGAAEPVAEPAPESVEQKAVAAFEPGRWGNRTVTIDDVSFRDSAGRARHVFATGETLRIELRFSAPESTDDFVFGFGIFSTNGVSCYGTNTDLEDFEPALLDGKGVVRVVIPELQLVQGSYYLDVAVHGRDGTPYDYHRGLYSFRVNSRFGDVGVARLPHAWEFEGAVEWKRVGGIPGGTGQGRAETGE